MQNSPKFNFLGMIDHSRMNRSHNNVSKINKFNSIKINFRVKFFSFSHFVVILTHYFSHHYGNGRFDSYISFWLTRSSRYYLVKFQVRHEILDFHIKILSGNIGLLFKLHL